MWGPAEERLAETSRTIVFDAPGTGRSSTSPVPIPLPVVARLLTRVLDELGHERVDVAGYSLGGVMAQQFARTAPGAGPPARAGRDQLRLGQRAAGSPVAGADLHPRALPLAAALQGDEPPAGRQRPVPRPEPQARPGRAPQPPSAVVGRLRAAVPPGLDVVEPALVVPADDADARDRRHARPPGAGRELAPARLPAPGQPPAPPAGRGAPDALRPAERARRRLLADFFSSPDHARSTAWRTGEAVDDYERVEQALRAAPACSR